MSKFKKLVKNLDIDEQFTRNLKPDTEYNSVKNSIRHEPDYNMMADLLFLPTTDKGFKYLFVIVDLYTDLFDAIPLKGKSSDDVLNAMKKAFKGKYLKQPVSVQTDMGTEFKGVFHKYLYDKNVLHTQTVAGRHRQQSSIESLNRLLGRLLMGYMNTIEIETEKVFCNWTDILPRVIKELNEYRKQRRGSVLAKDNPYIIDDYSVPDKEPKFKIGDIVHEKLDRPENALGNLQNTPNFREGDFRISTVPKKIVKIIVMNDEPRYRYMLKGITNASFTESELMKSKSTVEKQKVKSIIDDMKTGGVKYYKVWWKNETRKQATWERRNDLINDGLTLMLDTYDLLIHKRVYDD